MAIAHVNGLDLYYRSTGAGEKMVLTHGSWASADTWQALTTALSDSYEVVAWDRRGHSRSQDGAGPGSYREDASDLAAIIEHLGAGPVHLVGNSSGGAIVLDLVAARPDLVRTAAVHEPAAFALLEGVDDEMLAAERAHETRVRRLIEEGRHQEAARYFIDEVGIGIDGWDSLPPELRDTLVANAPTVLDDIDEPYRIESIDWGGLADTATPLLVTLGTESSEILRASTRELGRRVPCELVEIPHTGHVPHRSHTEAYATLLVDFIDRSRSGV